MPGTVAAAVAEAQDVPKAQDGKKAKLSKNQMRRAKKKENKAKLRESRETSVASPPSTDPEDQKQPEPEAPRSPTEDDFGAQSYSDIAEEDPLYAKFKGVFDRFEPSNEESDDVADAKGEVYFGDDAEIPDEDEDDVEQAEIKLSKKARKARDKLSVAELKALVKKPEIVDWTDTSAHDPRLLVHIKSYRNVVPVPAHWSLKREYLSSKRGVEKAAFSLPKFISETGIGEMRDAVLEKQDQASLKQKQRERVAPKMGKLDIDYQKLYEAFFRFQTKPELTRYGEVYYEGKEHETNLRHLRPGELSDELKDALSIPPGAPPPWLLNQQRFGPPPSYPALKIPGLNAPIPAGASWGYQPGGYGKPPTDEFNRPLWGGDIYGVIQPQSNAHVGEPVERNLWGELQEPEEESEDEEEEESEDEDDGEAGDEEDVGAGLRTPAGTETPAGTASAMPTEYGGEQSVSGEFDVRKQRSGIDTEESVQPRSAYTVLPEKQGRVSGFFGSERTYDLNSSNQRNEHIPVLGENDGARKRKKPGDVDVALDPDALQAADGMSKDEVRRRFESQKQEESGNWGFQEDLSDMIAQESQKRLKRDSEKRSRR